MNQDIKYSKSTILYNIHLIRNEDGLECDILANGPFDINRASQNLETTNIYKVGLSLFEVREAP